MKIILDKFKQYYPEFNYKEKILSLTGKIPVSEFVGLRLLIKIYRLDVKDIRVNWQVVKVRSEELVNMSITQIKSKIEELNNNLDYLLEQKEQAFSMTQPKATQLKEISVIGGKRESIYDKYVIKNEKLDPAIDFLQNQIKLLENYLNKELKRISKYDEWEQKVIYLREAGNTWLYIACNTPFSVRTCQRIYSKYTKKRDVY